MLLTRSPVSPPRRVVLPRLACVRRAASVRPEPGSNSPLEISTTPAEPAAEDPWMKSLSLVQGQLLAIRNQFQTTVQFHGDAARGGVTGQSRGRGACALAFDTLCSFQGADPRRSPRSAHNKCGGSFRTRTHEACASSWEPPEVVLPSLAAVRHGTPGTVRCQPSAAVRQPTGAIRRAAVGEP